METSYNSLQQHDLEYIKEQYSRYNPNPESGEVMLMKEIQQTIADRYGVTRRTVRNWANSLGIGFTMESIDTNRILVYDIETSRVKANVFNTGKQYIHYTQLEGEPKIITVAWTWLGSGKIEYLTWDRNHSDETLIRKFLDVFNTADMVVGFNNKRFDERWLVARAIKYNLYINMHVRSYDLYKFLKGKAWLPSYSMDYATLFTKVERKQSHEGIHMWNMIENGTREEQKEYLEKMVDYNCGDIASTEALYFRLNKWAPHVTHFGVLKGKEKYTCGKCGGDNVEFVRNYATAAGTIQKVMRCGDCDGYEYRISKTDYQKFLEDGESLS